MNATTTRLALRLHRFELLGLGALIVVACALTVLVSSWMDGAGFGPECVRQMLAGANSSSTCERAQRAFDAARGAPLVGMTQFLLAGIPFLLGAMAGVAVVGRELERGTTRLAWALAPSRTCWFVGRVVPVLIVVLALSFIAGAAADRLVRAMSPETDTANGFLLFGFRGVVLASRATFGFAVAVLAGTVIGRALPALLVAAVITVVGLAGGSAVHTRILEREAVPLVGDMDQQENLHFASGFVLPDGRFVGWEEMTAIEPMPADGSASWPGPQYRQASLVVPGSRYRFVEARESLVLAGGALVALALAGLVVRRVRPG